MISQLLALALLASEPDARALRQELDAVACRIEQLKARRRSGEAVEGELNALLVRSQELAEELERAKPSAARADPRARPPGDEPAREQQEEQLRERASALRDEADRVARKVRLVEARIEATLRSATAAPASPRRQEPGATYATLIRSGPSANASSAPAPATPALAALVEQRAKLSARAQELEREATELDAQADALEE